MRSLLSINDLSRDDQLALVAAGRRFRLRGRRQAPVLDGAVVGVYFRKTSTRTRTGFSAGALRLGGRVVTFGPDDLQINTGETEADTARVLGRMLDILVVRTAGPEEELRTLAAHSRMSVVNAMGAAEHPTQALADLTTLLCYFDRIEGLRILYVGEGNSTAAALALALTRFEGVRLEMRTPAGYGLAPEVLARVDQQTSATGAVLVERHTMTDPPHACDVIYTTRWETTGTNKPDPTWRERFAPFRVDVDLWRSSPDAIFMHDLPAHRGCEVTGDVIDGPASIVFDQAENKMYAAMAVLDWCWRGRDREEASAVATLAAGTPQP